MSQLTTHILDTTQGKPAAGVQIVLYQWQTTDWKEIVRGFTNNDGRINDWLPKDELLPGGQYKLKFETGDYYKQLLIPSFYPYVEVAFSITDSSHYHVPLLLNPFGYSTYRGS
ncbi:hydroxyisourate hydrolase [Longitalea luteola]|uniref:hydroxyisourate hydrolase n=1 Tax=Longitalea luteola TaxID=2812563 RepID=UPI001A970B57|nr:hydroxyisourate hydrolase [Longitalea luteola]